MKEKIEKLIKEAILKLAWGNNKEIINLISLEHPKIDSYGDYSFPFIKFIQTYLGVQRRLNKKYPNASIKINLSNINAPIEAANKLKIELEKNIPNEIERVEVAGPGFINFYLSREFFVESIKEINEKGENWGKNKILEGKKVMVEYTDPNPFKPFHIGHLMANTIGESISRIVEFSGAKTIRANYQGDVGPHVAKAIYWMLKNNSSTNSVMTEFVEPAKQTLYIGECYVKGSNLYDTDENIKKEIDEINQKIYDKSNKEINKIYDWGRKITLEAFEDIYKILGTKFDYYFFESEMAPIGEKIVRENIPKVFQDSNGAIVFHGEEYDKKLHTRVFINSQGLPTYETKEIGLALTKFKKEPDLDLSIVTTAIEQKEYMKVVQKAISIIYPELEKKMKHITHGMMNLSTGKMSSRKGNIVTGESLLQDSVNKVINIMNNSKLGMKTLLVSDNKDHLIKRTFDIDKIAKQVGVSALKYSILKSSIGSNIVYDFEKSISFEGDSGPYLQYTAVRANAIIKKAKDFDIKNKTPARLSGGEIPKNTTDLEKKLYQFSEIVEYSYQKLEPHHITTYLTELASSFNAFYGNTQILKDENIYAKYQLDLVKAFYQTMQNGLWILGIEIPERM